MGNRIEICLDLLMMMKSYLSKFDHWDLYVRVVFDRFQEYVIEIDLLMKQE